MALTNDGSSMLLKTLAGETAANTVCYMGLSTTTPGSDGSNFTEPSAASGYSRAFIAQYSNPQFNKMGEPSNGTIANDELITFSEATASWGTITHFGLFKSLSDTTPYLTGALTSSVSVPQNYMVILRVNAFSMTIA